VQEEKEKPDPIAADGEKERCKPAQLKDKHSSGRDNEICSSAIEQVEQKAKRLEQIKAASLFLARCISWCRRCCGNELFFFAF
jgi:hypothetical protein